MTASRPRRLSGLYDARPNRPGFTREVAIMPRNNSSGKSYQWTERCSASIGPKQFRITGIWMVVTNLRQEAPCYQRKMPGLASIRRMFRIVSGCVRHVSGEKEPLQRVHAIVEFYPGRRIPGPPACAANPRGAPVMNQHSRSNDKAGCETATQITGAMADGLFDSGARQHQRTTACFLAAISSGAPQLRFSHSRHRAHGRRR